MSTRCQIEFKEITNYLDRKKPIIERRTIYRHNDGYPDGNYGVIEHLKKFLKWDEGFDIEGTPANFIYWNKKQVINHLLENVKIEEEKQEIIDRWEKLSFGICENDQFHGDLAYFYELVNTITETKKNEYIKSMNIFVYNVKREKTPKGFLKPITRENLILIKKIKVAK